MRYIRLSRFLSFFISFALMISTLPITAIADELFNISEHEVSIVRKNYDKSYFLLDKELSPIIELVLELDTLDTYPHSPLRSLKEHIDAGYTIIEYSSAMELLAYIENYLDHDKHLNAEQQQRLTAQLEKVFKSVSEGKLSIDAALLEKIQTRKNTRTFTNIATVKGLLSVNDELVQNITAVNLSATDEIISNSLTILPFTTPGVIHNNGSGLLSASLIVNADITDGTIANSKLATASSSNTSGYIVVRDVSGDFATNMITIAGTPTNPTDVATKAYVDTVAATGIVAHPPARVVSLSNVDVTTGGLLTIDGVTLSANDRVLLINQTNPIENGLWLAQSGAWTRPTDFANGTEAGQAYVLILEGAVNAGSSYLCSTPTAIIGTDPIQFSLFSLPDVTTGANVGSGTGLVFRNKTGITLNFRSLLQGNHIAITNNADDITLATDGTSANTASTLVARDASGNFSAGAISITDEVVSSSLTITPFSTAGVVHNNASGLLSSSLIVNADVSPTAAIVDTKLATISTAGKVANSATTATSANTANTIVLRDASGNFSAGSVSFTDAVIDNLTIANCISSLCVTTLSTVDTAVSGSLSVADEVVNGSVTITPFTTAGVVHNNSSGLLSSSLIVNADVSPTAAIVDTKLATISTAGKVANSATTATSADTANTIVLRDSSGNFATNMITIDGTVTNNTDATTKAYVDSLSLQVKTPALVLGTSNVDVTTGGLLTIDGVTLAANDRVLLINQTNPVENGLWLAQSGAWTRPTDFNTGSTAGTAYVLIEEGAVNAGSSYVCTTPNAIIDTDPIQFTLFAEASSTEAANVGSGTGLVFRDKTGVTLNFRSLLQGNFITVTNNANDITIATNGTAANTASTLVARSASGGFSTSAISVADEVVSSSLTITPFSTAGVVHNDASGLLSSSLIVNADVSPTAAIVDTKLATISTAGKVANSATTATSADTANTIVLRDSSGNFATNMITIDGIVTNPTDVATKAYADSLVGTGGTNLNTPNTLVRRDGTGSFAAQIVSVVDTVASGNLVLSTNPSTSTAGNVMKGSNRFIHNTGTNNTFLGVSAGNFGLISSGQGNVGIGTNALTTNTTGGNNTAVGFNALTTNTGSTNVAIGESALKLNTTGNSNVAVGNSALQNNTTGTFNTAVGVGALTTSTTTQSNTAIGYNAMASNTTGIQNTALGASAFPALTTGGNNIAIGYVAGATLTTGSGNIYINASAGSAAESSTTRIGTSQAECFIAGITGVGVDGDVVVVNTNGQLGITLSSERFKHNIQDMADSSNNIMNLRPVTFAYNDDEEETMQYGLIAEEVDAIFPEIVSRDEEGKPYTVRYQVLPILLLNEIQKQHKIIEEIKQNYVTQEAMNIAINNLQAEILRHFS